MVSKTKDSIGSTLSERDGMNTDNELMLVGLRPTDLSVPLQAGAHFFTKGDTPSMANDQGWMTSVAYSPSLGHSIGLGYLRRGDTRKGEVVRAYDPLRKRDYEVEVVSAHFIDPDGERLRA